MNPYDAWKIVSIHALLAECDGFRPRIKRLSPCFNPRTPCGVRHNCEPDRGRLIRFQSTHSLRSATRAAISDFLVCSVSIHALLAECDEKPAGKRAYFKSFNPRTPCGVRPATTPAGGMIHPFQSTHSLRSATAPDHIHCYSTAQTILCANLPKKAIIT